MNSQLLFLLSAIGGLNGLVLSAYFAFFIKKKSKATYFLAALLLVVSTRITKSAFLYFNNSEGIVWFVQVGLIACALIGPFLYLYIKEETALQHTPKYLWLWHVLPITIILVILFSVFPYSTEHFFWDRVISWGIYWQWFVYLAISIGMLNGTLIKFFTKTKKLNTKEIWLVNLVLGVFVVWMAYRTSRYTSYIVGALSFSFVFYMSIVLWILKRKSTLLFYDTKIKYRNSTISEEEANLISKKITEIFSKEKLYRNPNLKLNKLADRLELSSHQLSQYLNANLQKSFNQFVNEYRIEEAKELLLTNTHFTLEGIGYEAGFSSKSTFYATFKKNVGETPAQFRKQVLL